MSRYSVEAPTISKILLAVIRAYDLTGNPCQLGFASLFLFLSWSAVQLAAWFWRIFSAVSTDIQDFTSQATECIAAERSPNTASPFCRAVLWL